MVYNNNAGLLVGKGLKQGMLLGKHKALDLYMYTRGSCEITLL